MAAITAAQAIISGSFSLATQAIGLGLSPPFRVQHKSKSLQGQIFVPFINWVLMIISIIIVAMFGTNTDINNAYGVTVCTMMIITTFFYAALIRNYWKRSVVVTMIFFIGFIGFDGMYFSSVILKVASGGWVAILISIFFFVTFFSWWYGQRCLNEVSSRIHTGTPIKDFVARRVHEETTEEEEEEETTTHEIENKFNTVDLIDGSHIKVGRTPTNGSFSFITTLK